MDSDGNSAGGTLKAGASLFISYARADRERVRPLADALSAAGYDVWWDALIDGGAAFAKLIEEKLEGADAVIAVWSATSVASDWVRDEAAHGRDRKRLVPVRLDGVEPPLGFRQYHAIDLSRWNKRRDAAEFVSLERGIAAAGSEGLAAPSPAGATSGGFSRRKLMVAGGCAGAGAVIAAALVAFKPWQNSSANHAVAVLPFANLSGDTGQDYFADGLCEEVRAALVRIAGLKVAAPTSSNEFRGRKEDAQTIAGKLGVGFLLEGSVRKAGAMVRIDATLTDAATGFASWTQSFDRKLDDIFALQSEIADTVAGALLARVVDTGGKTPGGTAVVAAYDAFLRGRALFNADSGEESDRAALARFDEAIDLDPRFAAALAARSRSLSAIASLYAKAGDIVGTYGQAVEAARKSVALAPDLAAAHLAQGYATLSGFLDFKGARAAYDRAYALGQGDADVLLMFAFFTSKSGRIEEALQVVARAEQLDPLNPRTFRAEGSILLGQGRYAESIASSRKALAMNPKLGTANGYIGVAQLMLGKLSEAKEAFAREKVRSAQLSGLAIVEHRLGNGATSQEAMRQLIAELGDSAAYQQAQVLAQLGRKDEALAALDRAYAVRDGGMASVMVDPLFEPLRSDNRFKQLLGRMGLA